jgi:hypothetical protein
METIVIRLENDSSYIASAFVVPIRRKPRRIGQPQQWSRTREAAPNNPAGGLRHQ